MAQQMRDAFSQALVELGKEYKDLYVMDADLNTSTRTVAYLKNYPQRYVQAGICDRNICCILRQVVFRHSS